MKKLLFILALFISGSCLITCSSDDDDDPVKTDKIIGKWQLTKEYLNGVELPLDDCELQMTIDFVENGTYTEREYEYDEDEVECMSLPVKNGTWEFLGNSSYFISDIGVESLEIKFSGNTMTASYTETIDDLIFEIEVVFTKVN